MTDKQFIFAGNRFFVLDEMLKSGLNVTYVLAVKGSYLEKELINRNIPYETIPDKKWLVEKLSNTDFDIFLSNGLPYILPIIKLKGNTGKRFINIHPSYLPDLRGVDPVPGALLFGRDSGATCHEMDDSIDGGDIISQVKIEYNENLDCGLLYQLSFMAEKDAFNIALERNFRPSHKQQLEPGHVYYTFKEADLEFKLTDDAVDIFRRIKAFNTRSKGAYFMHQGKKIKVMDVEVVEHPYLRDERQKSNDNEIVFWYENKCLLKKGNIFLKFSFWQ